MKFLVVLSAFVAAAFAANLGHVVDSRIGHSIHQGSQVVGHQQGHPLVSQTLIPGHTQVSSHQGPTRVSERVVGGTPAVSHYQNTHLTQINAQHHRTDTLHTQHAVPVTTLTQTRHYQPESHTTQHHSSSRSSSLHAIPHQSSHVTTHRRSELETRVNHHDNHGLGLGLGHGAIISH